jgi:ABC-type amino acid transport substrate-binding protein
MHFQRTVYRGSTRIRHPECVVLLGVLAGSLAAGCSDPAPDPPVEDTPRVTPVMTAGPPPPVTGPSLAEARESGEVTLQVLYVTSSGFAYLDADGELTGVTVELTRAFADWLEENEGMAVELEFREEERWAEFYQRVGVSEGGVLGLGNVTITDERRQQLDFSPPYLNNVATLMTHEDVPELDDMEAIGEAFSDLTGLIYPGTLHEARMEELRRTHFPGMDTVVVESNTELVGRVASGEGYFGYIDIYNYWGALEDGASLRRHPVGDDDSETFGVILPRGSEWTPLLTDFMLAEGPIQETAWYRELLAEHLGEDLAGMLQGPE